MRSFDAPAWLILDRAGGDLPGQIDSAFRARILAGDLPAGTRLPSSRLLAAALGVARSTVVDAFERLKAEGYLIARAGSGTQVAVLAPSPLRGRRAEVASPRMPDALPSVAGLFRPGIPDLADFPRAAWARCLAARARRLDGSALGYDAPSGLPALREAVLEHVSATRGVVARPEQVLILPTTRAAIDLLARLMVLRDGAGPPVAWIEEPGYPAARALLAAAGARLVGIACDRSGIDPGLGEAPPRLIYVTPSHQYPTGVTLSLSRRLALLEVARRHRALILEDDYDSEFQYGSRPIAALQGIDRADCVAYLGTFAKVLAPGLRVAYAIVPRMLAEEAAAAIERQGLAVPVHIQAALADFIREGRLRAHLRRMKQIYEARMAATVAALIRHCDAVLEVPPGSGGLQLAAWFRDRATDDAAAAQRLARRGYGILPMSAFHLGPARPGLVLGIARMGVDDADGAVAGIAHVLMRVG
ncbi:MocR-like pyridoxine biosynthesis transcription factor PdxR [Ensifer soli]|uniref:MocR-like pyridoxine biosynthesis transcription factor PdxR n=1 Tax=Ciceribacter sp. sgz301302 TaxID=3342379 RepID=UPI0035B8109E